jgi:hypothetical protein
MMIWRIFCPWRNEIACEWEPVACWLTEELYTGFLWGKQKEKFHYSDPSSNGRMFLKWIFQEVGRRGMSFIETTKVREKWREFVSGELKVRFL